MTDFATGWDDGTLEHGRPTAIAFSDDGRLFVGDDQKGVIFWIAAMTQ
jgi:glucose/arabinose dehydrogenase